MIKYIAFLFYGKYLQLQYYINFLLMDVGVRLKIIFI